MYSPFFEMSKVNTVYSNNFYKLNILGIVIFIILIFIIFKVISKFNKLFGLIFLSNIDLLATVLNYNAGPYYTRMFSFNYSNNFGIYSYISKLIINFISLISIFYIILYYHKKKTQHTKFLIAIICLLFTYLIPNKIIVYFMYRLDVYLYDKKQEIKYQTQDSFRFSITNYTIIILSGILIAFLFILIENFTVKYFIE
jgi:hypothetical protein